MVPSIILGTAVGPSQKAQDFESESIVNGAGHSQTAKAAPSTIDYGLKDCAFRPASTAVSRSITNPDWLQLRKVMKEKFQEFDETVEFLYRSTVKTIQMLLTNPGLFLSLPDQPTHFTRKQIGLPLPLQVDKGQFYVILKPTKRSPPFGKGAYKQVYHAIELKTFSFAAWAKVIIREGIKEMVEQEIAIQSQLTHPGIVKLYHHTYYSTNLKQKIGIMMEYCEFDLIEVLSDLDTNPYSEKEKRQLWKVLQDVTGALAAMEAKRIHHRDIKPENILIKIENEKWRGKIGDFGFATTLELEMLQYDYLGTPSYFSPNYCKGMSRAKEGSEMIEQKMNSSRFVLSRYMNNSESTMKRGQAMIDTGTFLYAQTIHDIWSLGLTIYELRTGRDSFELICDETNEDMSKDKVCAAICNVEQGHIRSKFPETISPNSLTELNYAMLSIDSQKRPTAKECYLKIRDLRKRKVPFE